MGDTQQMLPNPVREWLVAFIAEQTGVTNPTGLFFAWMGYGQGVVSFSEGGSTDFRAIRRLKIDGGDADMLREIETGREPNTRVQPWEDDERPVGWSRR